MASEQRRQRRRGQAKHGSNFLAPTEAPSKWVRAFRCLAGAILGAVVALALVQQLLLSVHQVRGVSMEPALQDGERVLVLKPLGQIARGDLLVFRNPIDPDQVLVKRVLALSGEEIAARGGQLYLNQRRFEEPYATDQPLPELLPTRVPAEHFFVVGDNRQASIDSRQLGTVGRRHVVGKVLRTLWR